MSTVPAGHGPDDGPAIRAAGIAGPGKSVMLASWLAQNVPLGAGIWITDPKDPGGAFGLSRLEMSSRSAMSARACRLHRSPARPSGLAAVSCRPAMTCRPGPVSGSRLLGSGCRGAGGGRTVPAAGCQVMPGTVRRRGKPRGCGAR